MCANPCKADSLLRLVAELQQTSSPAVRELHCPLPPAIHPEFADIQSRSVEWARRSGLAPSDKAAARVDASRIGWLVARAFPGGDAAWVQLAADWTTVFCLLDDHIERADSPAGVVACLADCASALRHGRRPGQSGLVGACASLHERLSAAAPPGWMDRFHASVDQLFAAFAAEAEVRRAGEIPALDTYVPMREITVGVRVLLGFGEAACAAPLPEAARRHPVVTALERKACNIVGWANDLFTYRKELSAGEVTNLVAVLADGGRLPLGTAVEEAASMHDEEVRSLLSLSSNLPSFGEAGDRAVRAYVGTLRTWVRGHLDWAHETGRYDPRREDTAAPAAATRARQADARRGSAPEITVEA